MWLIRLALRRPITIVVVVIGLALAAVLAIVRMPVDIFPDLNLPVIYVAQPYGGMSPAQMEGHLTYYYEYHFLYISGIESVESKSIQNVALLKLTFHPGTDMSQALAQTISLRQSRAGVHAARAPCRRSSCGSMPAVCRSDISCFPARRAASARSRTWRSTACGRSSRRLPGVSAPPPFGGNQRTIVISVDPDRLRAYSMSPQEVIRAVSTGNVITPAGTVNTGGPHAHGADQFDGRQHSGSARPADPHRRGPAVSLRDIGTVADSSDIAGRLRARQLPAGDLHPGHQARGRFDDRRRRTPSRRTSRGFRRSFRMTSRSATSWISHAMSRTRCRPLIREGAARRAPDRPHGLAVPARLAQCRDRRRRRFHSRCWPPWSRCGRAGQTINIMTLGGLALAVGILVDRGDGHDREHSHAICARTRPRRAPCSTRRVK